MAPLHSALGAPIPRHPHGILYQLGSGKGTPTVEGATGSEGNPAANGSVIPGNLASFAFGSLRGGCAALRNP